MRFLTTIRLPYCSNFLYAKNTQERPPHRPESRIAVSTPTKTTVTVPAAPKATAAKSAPALTFEDVDKPVMSRALADNPFTSVVEELVEKFRAGKLDKAKSFTAPADDVAKLSRQLGKAGNAAGVTIKQKREEVGNGRVRVTFLPAEKINRPRASAADAPQTETAPVG